MLSDGVKQHFEHFSRDVLCEYPHHQRPRPNVSYTTSIIIGCQEKKRQSIVDVLEELHQILQRGNQLQITDENIRQMRKN